MGFLIGGCQKKRAKGNEEGGVAVADMARYGDNTLKEKDSETTRIKNPRGAPWGKNGEGGRGNGRQY